MVQVYLMRLCKAANAAIYALEYPRCGCCHRIGSTVLLAAARNDVAHCGLTRSSHSLRSDSFPCGRAENVPTGIESVVLAYRWLLDSGTPPGKVRATPRERPSDDLVLSVRKVVFLGDSAGCNLILGTLCAIRDRELPMPAGAVLLSPWVDFGDQQETESWRNNQVSSAPLP